MKTKKKGISIVIRARIRIQRQVEEQYGIMWILKTGIDVIVLIQILVITLFKSINQ